MPEKISIPASAAARQFLMGKGTPAAPRPRPSRIMNLATVVLVIVGIGAIALLAFWSMSPPPFSAANLMNGTWTGTVVSSELGGDLLGKYTTFSIDVGDQTSENPSGDGHALFNYDRAIGDHVSFAGYELLPEVLVFDTVHVNGFMWGWTGACKGAKLCSIAALSSTSVVFTVFSGDDAQTAATTYMLMREDADRGWRGVLTHKVKYVVAMFVVIAVLKFVVARLQPGYSNELHRRRRMVGGRR